MHHAAGVEMLVAGAEAPGIGPPLLRLADVERSDQLAEAAAVAQQLEMRRDRLGG
jgi:hypothetical protein